MHFIDSLHTKLEQMGATNSSNTKLEIVKTLTPFELGVVKLALDPSINFFIAKLPLTASGSSEWGSREYLLLNDLSSRKITGNAARSRVAEVLEDLKVEHASVLRRVILKDLKVKVGDTLVNKAFPGAIPVTPYMRCSLPEKSNMPKWTDDDWFTGIISQEKADGMFASLTRWEGSFTMASRQGSVFPGDAMAPIFSELRSRIVDDLQTHGELLVYKAGVLLERGADLLGKVFTVRANGVLYPSTSKDTYSLFLPRFVEERLDKPEADTLGHIIDQFKAAAGV